ncbi:MAG: hypothetical protein WD689_00860 [Gaiellaceae bacterium]
MDRVSEARPFVERAMHDEELRDHVRDAFTAARGAYADLFGDRGMTGVAMRAATDKDVQDNLKKAIDELRAAANRLQGKEDHKARNSMLLIAGAAAALLFNPVTGPTTRQWLREALSGSDDEFGYASGDGQGGQPES